MLDQNTDRLWYVIGAVLIGGAIILLLNGTAPNLFAQVAGTYEELTEEATDATESLTDGNLFNPNAVENTGIYGYSSTSIGPQGTKRLTTGNNMRGYSLQVEPGDVYRIERSDKRNSRFGYAFAKEEPNTSGVTLYDVNATYQNDLVIPEIAVPEGMNYLYLYLYDVNAASSDLPEITIEQIG